MHTNSSVKDVLHVVASLRRGGTENACLALAKEFNTRGITNNAFVVEFGDAPMLNEYEGTFQDVVRSDVGRFVRAFKLFQLCRSMRPNLVIFHLFNIEHVILAIAARIAGVQSIIVKQGNPVLAIGSSGLKSKLSQVLRATRLLRLKLVCSSAWIKQSMASIGTLPAITKVVHNGCDVTEISKRAESSRRLKHQAPTQFGMIARLDPIKDHATLIRAVAELRKVPDLQGFKLRLIGSGPAEASLENLVDELGLRGTVEFMGVRGDIPEFLGELDLFVFSTTRDEGFGIVLIEALAAGVPIIASDVPACREVLRDGALGTLVTAGSAEDLASAIKHGLTHRVETPDIETVERLYGKTAMADGYLSLA